ncbi:M3 family metallopeptidase [Wenyingzhuangia sp. 2_MG-2023]|uniref:M3 family metallopeptidase n=1 Tax=Wenyingzhuangia sp. 2_MG-2023 TaxID=3062639 RepID=UPI0026E2DCAA|nr:M3 family metallopeptidase [Wenyingzhuangia sp. 2_MG-2023]MDO6736856.1 M3 family metallopeptidase [Wenyingzhuangia sp. 2_MG-2023]
MNNPLLQEFNTPYTTAPFEQIKNEHYQPAFEQAIKESKAEIDAIVNNSEAPTFENTIEALDFSGYKLSRISSIFFNLNSAETNDEMQKIAQEVSPILTAFSNDVSLNFELFERVKTIYEQRNELKLTAEELMLLEKKYKGFSRNGANLNDIDKEKLRAIDTELSKLSLTFGENVLAETQNYELHITDKENLSGLPEGAIEDAAQTAKSKNKEGWIFTLDYPSYIPFMTYADNRELRKELSIVAGKKGFQDNEYNNEEIVLKMVKLRAQRSQLLGYKNHAHFVLEERMAESAEKVTTFLEDFLEKAKPKAVEQFNQLQEFATKKDGIKILQKWDGGYYSEKLKQELFDFDEEILKPYFQLENVIDGSFEIAKRLYGLHFKEVTTIQKYHPDVKTYEVTDENGDFIAVYYADFHPRPGKRNGAWKTGYKSQWIKDGENSRPHISIVCNFTKPTATKPSLLTFNEVTTLFHEFGHALHGMLANTTFPSLSGTSVSWDFVELPSQVMENWCFEKEALELFAKHYKTGEIIPIELIEKIKKASNFLEGLQTFRQVSFGILDMAWHSLGESDLAVGNSKINVKDFETEAFKSTQLYPDVAENCMSTAFSHIFQGGYSAGYYSYKWAEVLDADAFEYFKETGIFNKETASKFKDFVLSQGGTQKPMELYKQFRGHEPKPDALLKRAGLL